MVYNSLVFYCFVTHKFKLASISSKINGLNIFFIWRAHIFKCTFCIHIIFRGETAIFSLRFERLISLSHTVNSGSEIVEAKHVSGKNIYWSTFIGKSKERKIFDFLHCPFEPPAKQHRPVCQLGWILWCMLARPSKGQCRNSKIFPPLLLAVKVDQNIFFLETCFASTISEPEFTVCQCTTV